MPKNSSEFKKFERENYLIEIDKTGLLYIKFIRSFYKSENRDKVITETQDLLIDALILMSNNFFEEYRVIVDCTLITNTDFFPIQTRKAFVEVISNGNIKKIAVFTNRRNEVGRPLLMIFKAMDVLLASCKMQLFNNESEALKWIRE